MTAQGIVPCSTEELTTRNVTRPLEIALATMMLIPNAIRYVESGRFRAHKRSIVGDDQKLPVTVFWGLVLGWMRLGHCIVVVAVIVAAESLIADVAENEECGPGHRYTALAGEVQQVVTENGCY